MSGASPDVNFEVLQETYQWLIQIVGQYLATPGIFSSRLVLSDKELGLRKTKNKGNGNLLSFMSLTKFSQSF